MLTQADFVSNITGTVVVANNSARIYLQTNTDLNFNFEGNERFKLILRKGATAESPIVAASNVVTIFDTSFVPNYQEITTDFTDYIEGDTIHFTLLHPYKESNVTLYYRTQGNVTNNTFVGGNTGTIITGVNESNLYLTTGANAVATSSTLSFVLQVSETLNGPPVLVSPTLYVLDSVFSSLGATGGTIVTEGTTKKHIFTASSAFSILRLPREAPVTISYMVQAGGGGGGTSPPATQTGGGGGAGGHRTGTLVIPHTDPLPAPYTITVGGGGGAAAGGNPSSAFGTTSTGGGRGAGPPAGVGNGGSGGGGKSGPGPTAGTGNSPPFTPSQGNPGSPTASYGPAYQPRGGGGGGGAGGAGATGTPSAPPFTPAIGRNGGVGRVSPLSPPSYGTTGPSPGRWFGGGGGGGGGGPTAPFPGGTGGSGGGGNGGTAANGGNGTGNTGGGGGGAGRTPTATRTGGSGGSGIVIISYPIAV